MNELKLFWDKQQINIALKLKKTLLWTFKHSESNKMLTIKIGILISLNGFKPTQLIQIIIMTKKMWPKRRIDAELYEQLIQKNPNMFRGVEDIELSL